MSASLFALTVTVLALSVNVVVSVAIGGTISRVCTLRKLEAGL